MIKYSVLFILLFSFLQLNADDKYIKTVLYKKFIYDYSIASVVNVILKNYNDINDITIFLNSKSIYNFNKVINTTNGHIESVNFLVNQYENNNYLEIFFENNAGAVTVYETELNFEKLIIFSDDTFYVNINKYFLIPTNNRNEEYDNSVEYELELSNSNLMLYPNDIKILNKKYFLLKSVDSGDCVIKINVTDPMIENGKKYLERIISLKIKN